MTPLPSLEIRDALRIDSLERAIVYSATLLKACYINSNQQAVTDKRIQITHRNEKDGAAKIIIRAELTFNMIFALRGGGQILNNLAANAEIQILNSTFTCSPSAVSLPEIPVISAASINTLEKYFYLCCSLLKASLSADNTAIEISFLEDDKTGGKTTINLTLPFNFLSWLNGGNYVCAVQRITDIYIDVGDTYKHIPNYNLAFNNQSQLNNLSILGN
jgi:hypothetical protein